MKIIVDKGDIFIKGGGKINVEADSDIKIKTSGKVDIDAGSVNVGGTDEASTNGESLVAAIGDLAQALSTDIRPSAMGPVAPAGSMKTFIETAVKCKLPAIAKIGLAENPFLSKNVKIKK